MAFEVVTTNTGTRAKRGVARLQRDGRFAFHPDDLEEVGISNEVVLLVDKDASMIAVRFAKVDERATKVQRRGDRLPGVIAAMAALARLGIKSAEAAKEYPVRIQDGMLIVAMRDNLGMPRDYKIETTTGQTRDDSEAYYAKKRDDDDEDGPPGAMAINPRRQSASDGPGR